MASFVGCVLGYPFAGPLTDLMSKYLKKKAGVHRPEHRIPALVFPFLIAPAGLLVFGYALAQHRKYIIAAIGYTMQSSALVMVPSVVLSYTVDAYPLQGGEALVFINAIKNTVAFGLIYATPSWFMGQGVNKMFLEFAGIQWGVYALGLPLYFISPCLRAKMSDFVN